MKAIDAAVAYAARGLSVLPIEPRGKKPLIRWERFQTERAAPQEIKKWFVETPGANVGIVTGAISDLIIIDIDRDDARDALKKIVGDCDLEAVPRSRTGKGWQLFFKHPGVSIQNRAGVIPGLDVRGDGGYVVAPPSIHPNGREYSWEIPLCHDLPKLPLELFNLISSPPGSSNSYRDKFHTAKALNGVPEGERDTTLFKLACKLRSADVPEDIAQSLLREAAKNCDPPFSEVIAVEKVSRAYRRYSPNGNSAKSQEKQPDFRLQFMSMKELLHLPPDHTRWLWDQTLPAAGASVLVSKPKIGKSTFAANLALAIARGLPFLGRNTQQSPVAYLSLDASLPEMIKAFQMQIAVG